MDRKAIIVPLLIIIFAVSLTYIVVTFQSQFTFVLVVIAVTGLALSFFKPTFALTLLIFSMMISPEIQIADVPGRAVAIRYDDILLISIFLGYLARTAILKQKVAFITSTPLNIPILAYILVCIIATIRGIMFEYVVPMKSFFFLLKYIEYFILFFMVANSIKNEKQIKIFFIAGLLTCLIIIINGYLLMKAGQRVTGLFDLEGGEPGSIGGYFLLIFGVVFALLIYSKSIIGQLLLSGLIIVMIPPFMNTFSRASYIGFIIMYVFLIIFSRRKKFILIVLLIFGILVYPFILPDQVKMRIAETFISERAVTIGESKVPLDASSFARIDFWTLMMKDKFLKHPFLGYGITGVGLVDSQYFRILGETGIIGFLIFVWLIFRIFRQTLKVYKNMPPQHWAKGIPLGFLITLCAIIFQGITTNSFIIVRIMEPFWFICAVTMMLPSVIKTDNPHSASLS